jgi:hypothetical protein
VVGAGEHDLRAALPQLLGVTAFGTRGTTGWRWRLHHPVRRGRRPRRAPPSSVTTAKEKLIAPSDQHGVAIRVEAIARGHASR